MIRHGPHERERPGDVVVGDDQRHTESLVDVLVDVADLVLDRLVRPALDGAPQVHADDLAEDAGIHPVDVVHGKFRAAPPCGLVPAPAISVMRRLYV